MFISPVDWNYYPYRDQELPRSMAERGYRCIYLNPVRYRGSENAVRFARLDQREDHPRVRIIDRRSRWGKSFIEFIHEQVLNIRAIRRCRPCAVISSDHLISLGPCLYCRVKGIPFVFDVTDRWELVDRSRAGMVYRLILKPLLARFSFAVTCTSNQQFLEFKKRRKKNTYLISNGIAPRTLEQLDQIRDHQRAEGEVNFVGSLRDWYDFGLLVDVFREFPEIQLNIYGWGPLLEKLQEMTADVPNVHMHGNVEHDRIPLLLSRSLFGILPLKENQLNHATCPIKLFDYWGASKAVISTPVREVRRVGGETVLYASGREEFVECIKKLTGDRDLLVRLGREGRKKIDETHNYDHITNQFLNILNPARCGRINTH